MHLSSLCPSVDTVVYFLREWRRWHCLVRMSTVTGTHRRSNSVVRSHSSWVEDSALCTEHGREACALLTCLTECPWSTLIWESGLLPLTPRTSLMRYEEDHRLFMLVKLSFCSGCHLVCVISQCTGCCFLASSGQVLHLIEERANICKQIHLPAQSGSSTVLQAMRRG